MTLKDIKNWRSTYNNDPSFSMSKQVDWLIAEVETLREVLTDARNHLEYCNYGDVWENECATEHKLPERISQALRETTQKGNSKILRRTTYD